MYRPIYDKSYVLRIGESVKSKRRATLYVIVYDLSSNNERNRLDKLLKGYGFRVQKSVYECHMTRWTKNTLLEHIEALDLKTGHVRCYCVHGNNLQKIGTYTQDKDDSAVYFID